MPRISRDTFSSGFFHIMIQGLNKEYIFKENHDKNKYLYLMKRYYSEYKIKMISYCIMNNHAHFIIYSNDIMEISNYMHKINTIYAMNYNRINKRVGYLFRDRYKSQYIYNKEYLLKCIKYIHMNPVKAGLVDKEQDYIYSSYNDFKHKKGYVDESVIKLVFNNKENYTNIFNNIQDSDIEIMDIDNNDNFEIAVKNYLVENKTELDEIKNNKNIMYDFTITMIKKRL